jgi:translation initiation factor 3 subunit J
MRRNEQEADLRHAEDLFGAVDLRNNRKPTVSSAVVLDVQDPHKTVDLASLPLFNPATKLQFEQLRTTLSPVITANSKKAHYTLFLREFTKQLASELPSDQIKKIASALTTLSNEKLKEDMAAEKGGNKTKAAKTKTTLVGVNRGPIADTSAYDDDFNDDDFM